MGNVSIDLSLENIWKCWFRFKSGKRRTLEMEHFQYFLEKNIYNLHNDLNFGNYHHAGYCKFIANDNKRREISVAEIRDRIVHRLIYEYLVEIFEKEFIFDVWSCRKGKGLIGAIEQTQKFLRKYPRNFIWRSDVRKFFDSIDHRELKNIIARKIPNQSVIEIIDEIIDSYCSINPRDCAAGEIKGIPIGNLTSQIFANIYLNELDQFVIKKIEPLEYLRYGDDFIIIGNSFDDLRKTKESVVIFLEEKLRLIINDKNDIIIKAKWGLKFLGVEIFPKGRKLRKRSWTRATDRVNFQNISSYKGLIDKHSKDKHKKYYDWIIINRLLDNFHNNL